MTIQESLNYLQDILQSVTEDDLKEHFADIAEALEMDISEVNQEDKDSMVSSIQETVSNNVEENDVEAVVEEIRKFFVEEDETEEDEEPVSEESEEPDKEEKPKKDKDSFFISTSDVDVTEDASAIFNGEELSEDFQEKAKTIFETAVVNKVNEKVSEIIEEYEDVIEEKTQEIEKEYSEKLDEYLDYVVSEWLKENKLAVENGIKSEMNESLMSNLKQVFENHYIDIPENKVDMVEDLQNKNQELEQKLNDTLEENAKLNKQLQENTKEEVIKSVMEGLSEMQREKIYDLLENAEVEEGDTDFSKFRKKAELIRENYFPTDKQTLDENSVSDDTEPVTEDMEENNSPVNRYAQTLSRISNNK